MKAWMICVVVAMALMGCNSGKKKGIAVSTERTGNTGGYPAGLFAIPHSYQYTGSVMEPDSTLIRYDLTITKNENISDGRYILITTLTDGEKGKSQTSTSRGSLSTLRGCANDRNATVYKLSDEIDDLVVYFKVTASDRVQLLTGQFENPGKENGLSYELSLVP